MPTAKAFTKGQPVTYVSSWDGNGTVTYRHAIVHSCGAKRMVLTCATTGEPMGREFAPELVDLTDGRGTYGWQGVYRRLTDADAVALCLEVGARIVAEEKASIAATLARTTDQPAAYRNAVQKDLDALHEPRAVEYHAAVAELRGELAGPTIEERRALELERMQSRASDLTRQALAETDRAFSDAVHAVIETAADNTGTSIYREGCDALEAGVLFDGSVGSLLAYGADPRVCAWFEARGFRW